MNFLTVAGIFKNESHVIKEWVEHYIDEGADNFLLIDNGSTDNYKEEIIEYIDAGVLSIVYDDTKWAQKELYNKYFHSLKGESSWVLVCDLDEFVYARNGFTTISSFLQKLKLEVGVVRIPWKMFGSSDMIEQPNKLIPAFIKRGKEDGRDRPWVSDKNKTLSKTIVRPELVNQYNLHFHYLKKWKFKVVGSDGGKLSYPESNKEKNFQPISEKILKKSYLHLNHYALQSLEWFKKVKMNRGDATTNNYENVRTLDYFHRYDNSSNDIVDDELAKKRYK